MSQVKSLTPAAKTNRDTQTQKLILRLQCRHVTPSSLTSSEIPTEIAQQVSEILASRKDQELAQGFSTILVHEQDPAVRLQLLATSQLDGKLLGTTQGFRTFVTKTVLDLYGAGHRELAKTVVSHLLVGRDVFALDEDGLRLVQPLGNAAKSPLTRPRPISSSGNLTSADSHDLHTSPSLIPKPEKHLSNASEAKAKRTAPEDAFNGQLVRWNAQDHAAGLYGDPADIASTSSNAGQVVLRRKLSQTGSPQGQDEQSVLEQARTDEYFWQGRAHDHDHWQQQQHQNASNHSELGSKVPNQVHSTWCEVTPNVFDIEFAQMDVEADTVAGTVDGATHPPLPTLSGNESWSHGIDDFIAQLNRGIPTKQSSPSDTETSPAKHRRKPACASPPPPASAPLPKPDMISATARRPPPSGESNIPAQVPHIAFERKATHTPPSVSPRDRNLLDAYRAQCQQRVDQFKTERNAEKDESKRTGRRKMLRTRSEEALEAMEVEDGG